MILSEILLTILIVLVVGLIFLIAVALIRTATFGQVFEPVEPIEGVQVDDAVVAEHLADVIRCQTISSLESVDRQPFEEIHRTLEKTYPRLHASLKLRQINQYSLLYTWVGSQPDLEPVLFAAHLDVVPADPSTLDQWEHDPFSGEIKDGFVWGRGTLDIKSQVVALMETVENLLRANYQPERTIMLAFGHDEEIGGLQGAHEIAETLKAEGVELYAVLDEGGMVAENVLPSIEMPTALVGNAEKGYLTLVFEVTAQPGHSSMPPAQSALGILSRAMARLESRPLPARLTHVKPLMHAVGPAAPFSAQLAMANTWLLGRPLRKALLSRPSTAAAVRTTTAVTQMHGGIKDNVLPARAQAAANFRLLPGDTIASVCEHVRKVIHDERVHFEPAHRGAWEATPVCPADDNAFQELERTIRQVFGNIPVAPYVVMGATDARHYTPVCGNVYRFTPIVMQQSDLDRFHGINERIPTAALATMVKFYTQIFHNWAGKS
jgi:carboxypeptidase PM20D1